MNGYSNGTGVRKRRVDERSGVHHHSCVRSHGLEQELQSCSTPPPTPETMEWSAEGVPAILSADMRLREVAVFLQLRSRRSSDQDDDAPPPPPETVDASAKDALPRREDP